MKELKRLIPYLKKYKNKLYLGLIFVTISNLSSTYIPRIVGNTIDTVSVGGFEMNTVLLNLLFILLLTLSSGFFMFRTRRTIIVASREIEYDIRKDLIEAIQSQSVSFFHRNSTGSLMAHATNDIPSAREFLGPAIMYSANTITTFSMALYYMFSLNVNIALVGLIPLPIIAFFTYILGKKFFITFKDVQAQFADLTTQAQESISGVRIIRAYTREFFEKFKFAEISKDYLKKNLKMAKLESIMMPSMMMLIGISQIAVLAYGGWLVIQNQATLGELTQFFIYLEMLIWPVAAIGWVTNLIQRGAASSARLGKLLDEKPNIIENESTNYKIDKVKGNISFSNVSLKYDGTVNNVLKNINLDIKAGMTVGIIGTVGAGKTSLINLIPRLYDVTGGIIKIDDVEIKHFPMDILSNSIGMVPQESFLFSDTIINNISFGKPDATMEEIIDICNKTMLLKEIETFEDGFETMLGERGITLSGGQKQRVALARAIIRNPEILILDDSLSAVDAQTEHSILENLKEIMKNRTTIVISHRISTIKDFDLIICMEDGEIKEMGNNEQLLNIDGIYSRMYKQQILEQEIMEI